MSSPESPDSQARSALLAGVGCYAFWGIVPLVFQAMSRTGAGPFEIIGHRCFWGAFWAGGLVLAAGQGREFARILRSPAVLGLLVLSTLLISTNWSLYVWAVVNGHTLDTSLGYYMTPLLSMAAGALVYRERLDRFARAAIALAVIGVGVQAVALGRLPWIAIVLSASFAGYGVVRKGVKAEAQAGLFVECLFLTAPAAAYLFWLQAHGQSHFLASPAAALWLLAAGPVTVLPLALFSWAARRMPLSSMGFLQFLAPTIVFAIGLFQGETFNGLRAVSFVFIWAGALVFGWGAWRAVRRARAAKEAPAAAEVCA